MILNRSAICAQGGVMPTIELLGGKIQIYQRGNSRFWQARASVGNKQRQFSTKQEIQDLAAKAAETWYFSLQGKNQAGVLNDRPIFKKAADQFLNVNRRGIRTPLWG
jgi:hypothetical protein